MPLDLPAIEEAEDESVDATDDDISNQIQQDGRCINEDAATLSNSVVDFLSQQESAKRKEKRGIILTHDTPTSFIVLSPV